MSCSIFDDETRFWSFLRGDTLWIYDERDTSLHAAPANDQEAIDELGKDLAEGEEPPAATFKTKTRVSNLKLALSNRCPSDCAYCFRPRGALPEPRPGLIRDALTSMVESFGADSGLYVVSFNLTSEPLANLGQLKELEEATLELSVRTGKPFHNYLCTSGTVQSPEALAALARVLRSKRVPISIDGPREVHNRHRKDTSGRGTYDRVMSLIDWATGRGMQLEAQAVLTRQYPYPDLVAEHLIELGFSSISMKPVRLGFVDAFAERDLPELFASYDRYFVRLESGLSRGDLSLLETLKHDYALRPLWKLVLGIKAEGRCIWGSTHLVMDSLGDFYPCDSVIGIEEFRCGSVDAGIDWERFHADVSWRVRQPCPDCWARSLCGGSCYVNGLTLDGNYLSIDPVECAMSRYFCEKCVGLVAALVESGEGLDRIRDSLLRY